MEQYQSGSGIFTRCKNCLRLILLGQRCTCGTKSN